MMNNFSVFFLLFIFSFGYFTRCILPCVRSFGTLFGVYFGGFYFTYPCLSYF